MREMKDSGIEWIGEIPKEWEVKKIKQLSDKSIENSFVDGDWIESSDITDEGIRYLTTGNIGDGEYKEQGNGFVSKDTFVKLNCKYAYSGDLVISRLNTPYGRSCILPDNYSEYVLAVDNVILRTHSDKRYICYATQCDGYQKAVEDNAKGTTMKRISRTNLGNILLPFPSVDTQHRIADYLDDKCGKIDRYIEQQKQVIEKLKAYKQSVITEAVTKGLDPTVPMKDSGVEWIGEIPEGWETRKMISILSMRVVDGPHESPQLISEGIPYISATAIENGKINFSLMRGYISSEYCDICDKRYKPKIDDILVIKLGASTGQVAIVETDERFNIWVPLAAVRCNNEAVPRFVYYAFQSDYFIKQMEMSWTFGTQQTLGVKTIERLKIALPKIEQQKDIVCYLDKNCSAIDSAIAKKQALIDKLTEYKKSLIYEVVTGKKEV